MCTTWGTSFTECWRSLSMNVWVHLHTLFTKMFWPEVTFYFIGAVSVCVMQDRDALSLKLEDTENWLYEDGEDQPKQVYIDKLAELKVWLLLTCMGLLCFLLLLTCTFYWLQNLGQPIIERYLEAEERPKAFEEMGRQIQQYMKFVEAYKMKVRPWIQNVCLALDTQICRHNQRNVHEVNNNVTGWSPGWTVWPFRWSRCDQSGQADQWCNDLDEQCHGTAEQNELVRQSVCQS